MLEIEPFNGPEEIENIQLNNKAANANLKVLESLDEHINDLKSNANTRIDVLNNLVSLSELWHEYIKIHDYLKKGKMKLLELEKKRFLEVDKISWTVLKKTIIMNMQEFPSR